MSIARHGTSRRARPPAEAILLGFARALRAAGVAVTADRERTFLEAVAAVGPQDPARGLLGRPGHALLGRRPTSSGYDRVFAAWFAGDPAPRTSATGPPPRRPRGRPRGAPTRRRRRAGRRDAVRADGQRHRGAAPARRRDPRPRRARGPLAAALRRLRPRRPAPPGAPAPRPAAAPSTRAGPCARTLRRWVSRARSHWRRAHHPPAPGRAAHRRLRVDERLRRRARCGSPTPCAGRGPPTEVFTLGTRLTHVTRPLRQRDPDRRHRRRRAGRPRLVRRHPARRGAQGLPRPLGPARHGPRRGRRDLQRRLGAGRPRGCSASRCAGCAGSPTGWSGSTRTGAGRLRPRAGRASSRRCRTSTTSSPVTAGGVRGADGGGRACVTCWTS